MQQLFFSFTSSNLQATYAEEDCHLYDAIFLDFRTSEFVTLQLRKFAIFNLRCFQDIFK